MPANYQGAYGMTLPDLGSLTQMPSLELTAEDKKRALDQALMQMGVGLMQRGRLGDGLQGGLLGYQQGLQAPAQRMEMYNKALETQGKQLKNAESLYNLTQQKSLDGLLGNIANTTASPFQMEATAPGAAGTGPLSPDSPEMQLGAQQAQAKMFQNPAMMAQLLASGMKGSDLTGIAARFDPQQIAAGGYSRNPLTNAMTYNADPTKGIGFANGAVSALPGAAAAQNELQFATESGKYAAQLNYDKAKLPFDVSRAGGVAGAEEAARFPFKVEPYYNPQTGQMGTRYVQEATGMPGTLGKIPASVQAQRDAVAQQVLDGEGNGQKFNPRLNDTGNGGVSPQLATLPRGQMPTARNSTEAAAQSEGIKATVERLGKSKDTAKELLNSGIALQQAQDAVKSGAYQGRFADWQSSAAAVATALPGVGDMFDSSKLANSQVAGKHLSEQILGRIKALGTNPSNSDREFITKTVAQLTNDPKSFERLTNYMQSMVSRGIEGHNADAASAHSVRGLTPQEIGTDYRVPVPDSLSASRKQVVTVFRNGTPAQKQALRAMGYVE